MRIIAEILLGGQRPRNPAPLAAGRALRTLAAATAAAALLSLAGCVYQMPIRQGNYLDPAAIAQVRPGMTHSQVRFLLGSPMVPGPFDNQRWDYDYYLILHHLQAPQRQHVTVYFQRDLVAHVESNVTAAPVTTVTRGGIKYPVPY